MLLRITVLLAITLHLASADEAHYVYQRLEGGGGACPTGQYVASVSECETAALQLGIGQQTRDGQVYKRAEGGVNNPDRPHGCYMFDSSSSLNFNQATNNKGKDITDEQLSIVYPICRLSGLQLASADEAGPKDCKLTQGTILGHETEGNDEGSNSCNTCACDDGTLTCTDKICDCGSTFDVEKETDQGVCTWTDTEDVDGSGVGFVKPPPFNDNVGFFSHTGLKWDHSAVVSPTGKEQLNAGRSYAAGPNSVTFTANDGHSNVRACAVNVVVNDNENPEYLQCPDDQSVNADKSCTATATWDAPTFKDNCAPEPATKKHPQTFHEFKAGDQHEDPKQITYSGTDAYGNAALCGFTVSMKDEVSPVLNMPTSIVFTLPTRADLVAEGSQCKNGLYNYEASLKHTIEQGAKEDGTGATDNCGKNNLDMTFNPAFPTLLALDPILHEFKVTVKDKSGNQATHTTHVTVNDDEKPTFGGNCPKDVSRALTGDRLTSLHQAEVSWTEPTAKDNYCDKETPLAVQRLNRFSCWTSETDSTPLETKFSEEECRATPPYAWKAQHENGAMWDPGQYNIEYQAVDASGNTEICKFVVTVTDERAPHIANCPTDEVGPIFTEFGDKAIVKFGEEHFPVFVNTPAIGSTITGEVYSPSIDRHAIPPGKYEQTYTVTQTDANGVPSTSVCEFWVVVEDIEKPEINHHDHLDGFVDEFGQCGGKVVSIESAEDGTFVEGYAPGVVQFNEATSADFSEAVCHEGLECAEETEYFSYCRSKGLLASSLTSTQLEERTTASPDSGVLLTFMLSAGAGVLLTLTVVGGHRLTQRYATPVDGYTEINEEEPYPFEAEVV